MTFTSYYNYWQKYQSRLIAQALRDVLDRERSFDDRPL